MTLYYIPICVGCFLSYQFYHLFNPKLFTYQYYEFWNKANYTGAFQFVFKYWYIFFTITISNFIGLFVFDNIRVETKKPVDQLIGGSIASIFAGISEEIVYRWLWFFSAIGTIALTDWFSGGFLFGHGLTYLVYIFTKYFVNLATFGILTDYIYSPNWLVGAAMMTAALEFRKGHEQYGVTGYWFSWYFGLFTQVIVFKFGIMPAIVVHILVDMMQDVLLFIYSIINRTKKFKRKKTK